jgi:hypothetical protein
MGSCRLCLPQRRRRRDESRYHDDGGGSSAGPMVRIRLHPAERVHKPPVPQRRPMRWSPVGCVLLRNGLIGQFEVAELRDQAERLPVYLVRERRLLLAASEVAANPSSAEIAPPLDYCSTSRRATPLSRGRSHNHKLTGEHTDTGMETHKSTGNCRSRGNRSMEPWLLLPRVGQARRRDQQLVRRPNRHHDGANRRANLPYHANRHWQMTGRQRIRATP